MKWISHCASKCGKFGSTGALEIPSCSQFPSVQLNNEMLTLFISNLFLCLILEEIFAVYPVSRTAANCQYFYRSISQSPQSAHWTGNMHFIYMICSFLCPGIFLYFKYRGQFYIYLSFATMKLNLKTLRLHNNKRWSRPLTYFLHILYNSLAFKIINGLTSLPNIGLIKKLEIFCICVWVHKCV